MAFIQADAWITAWYENSAASALLLTDPVANWSDMLLWAVADTLQLPQQPIHQLVARTHKNDSIYYQRPENILPCHSSSVQLVGKRSGWLTWQRCRGGGEDLSDMLNTCIWKWSNFLGNIFTVTGFIWVFFLFYTLGEKHIFALVWS